MDSIQYILPSIKVVLITFGSYIVASTVFFYYPELIHKNKSRTKKFKFVVLSHRGGSGENIENTLEAFKHSKEIGVDIIELDTHITKDEQVVVCHDNNLKRLAGIDKKISDLNYNELPELLEHINSEVFYNDSNENSKVNKISSNDNNLRSKKISEKNWKKIPLLEEVFEKFPDTPINLDIKIDNDVLIKKVNELIIKYNREKITVWGSFNESVTKKCLKLNPNIEAYFSLKVLHLSYFLSKGCFKLLFLIISGLIPFVPLKESYLEIIMPNFIVNKNLSFGTRFGFFLIRTFFIKKSIVRHLQRRGILVYYWVLNHEDEWAYALEMGVNGIITDYPTRLINYLENNTNKHKIIRKNNDSD